MQSKHDSLNSPHIDGLPVCIHSKARSSEHDSPGNRCSINEPVHTRTPKRHVQFIEPDQGETMYVPETPSFTSNAQQIKTRADETNVNHCREYIPETPCFSFVPSSWPESEITSNSVEHAEIPSSGLSHQFASRVHRKAK